MGNYITRALSKGEKIHVYGYEAKVPNRMENKDIAVLVPADSSLKAGDYIYCKCHWWGLRKLEKIENGMFYVSWSGNLIAIEFEDIKGKVFEIRKKDEVIRL